MGGRDRAGSRHSWLDTLTRSLSRIIAGQHAATLLGVSRTTLWRRMRDEHLL